MWILSLPNPCQDQKLQSWKNRLCSCDASKLILQTREVWIRIYTLCLYPNFSELFTLLNLFHMCDLCCVLLPGVTNVTTRQGPFKHQEGWTSFLDLVSPPSKMYRQARCIRKVNAATQAVWKRIWKIFKQIQKQVSTQPFHQNFLIWFPQPLSLERGLQRLTGSAAAQEMWPLSRNRAQTHAGGCQPSPSAGRAGWSGLKPARHNCCHKRYPESENILNSHITLTAVSPSNLCPAKNAPNPWKPPHLQGWVTCDSGIWLAELVL